MKLRPDQIHLAATKSHQEDNSDQANRPDQPEQNPRSDAWIGSRSRKPDAKPVKDWTRSLDQHPPRLPFALSPRINPFADQTPGLVDRGSTLS